IERLSAELQIQSLTDPQSLQERRVEHEQARTTQRSAGPVPEGPLERQGKGFRIEPLIGFPHNDLPLKVRIPVGHVGITGVAGTRSIGARQGRAGESASNPDARIPLPAADQLVYNASGAATAARPVPTRQHLAVLRVELVIEAS